jgi:hypothetical protein
MPSRQIGWRGGHGAPEPMRRALYDRQTISDLLIECGESLPDLPR